MNMNTIFKNEELVLKESIERIVSMNCIDNYIEYLFCDINSESMLEKEFNNILLNDRSNFISSIIMDDIKDLSNDDLIYRIITMHKEGVTNINTMKSADISYFIKSYISESEFYNLLKPYLIRKYNDLIADKTLSKQEEYIKNIKHNIDIINKKIEHDYVQTLNNNKTLERYRNELNKIITKND